MHIINTEYTQVKIQTWVVTEAHDDGQLTIKNTGADLKVVTDMLLIKEK